MRYSPDLYLYDDAVQYLPEYEDYAESARDVWENCVVESFMSIYYSIYKAVLINMVFGLITSFALPELLFHCLSGFSGIYLLYLTTQSTIALAVIFSYIIFTYLLLIVEVKFSSNSQQSNRIILFLQDYNIITFQVIIVLVLFEYILLDSNIWLSIRGIVMVLTMKIISLAGDIKTESLPSPSLPQYFGYMFCSSNILFGPWIKYNEYLLQTTSPSVKSFWWILGIIKSLFVSIFFLSISNCWLNYFISEDYNRFLVGYKEALSFRTSHYFICYLSESLMLAAGWKTLEKWSDIRHWRFEVTNPLTIEFPQALAIVIVNWNIPIHKFLKQYVYRKFLPLGKSYAIFLTFVMSSLLHGLEKKVSIVLILIGLFSMMQISVRDYLSETFDCCLQVRPCRDCQHTFKRNSLTSRAARIVFSCLTMLHLIYLGVLMDPSTDEVGIYKKWKDLHFISVWIMFLNYLILK